MTVFRWSEAWRDIALAKNVICFRPTKPVDWDEIAAKLSEGWFTIRRKGQASRRKASLDVIERFVNNARRGKKCERITTRGID